jgi:PAS domain S-box-containing protein
MSVLHAAGVPFSTEGELRKTLDQLGAQVALSPIGLAFVDRELRMSRMNATIEELTGSSVIGGVGLHVSELDPSVWPDIEVLCRRVLDGGDAVVDVEGIAPADGGWGLWRHRVMSYYPVALEGAIVGVGVVAVDVTDRRLVEDEVRFQADLLAAAGQAIIAVDLDRVVVYWNRAAEDLYGWSAAEAIGRRSTELLRRDETPGHLEAVAAEMRRGRSWSADYEVEARDGRRISVYVTNTPVFADDGRLRAIIGASVDMTERKAADAARRELAAIVECSGDAIYGVTTAGIINSWNPAAERLFGYAAAEIVGQPVGLLAPPGRVEELSAVRARLSAGGGPERYETTRLRKDGTLVEVVLTASTVRDADGQVIGIAAIAQDNTARLAYQRALEAGQRRLAEAQRTAHLGSFELDVASGVLTWSDEYYRILGIDSGLEATPDRFATALHPDDRSAVAKAWAAAVEHGRPFDIQLRIIRGDGEERHIHTRSVPQVDDAGKVELVAGTFLDETDRVVADGVRRSAENRFEIGFEQAAIGAAISDLDGLPSRVNPAICQFLGRTKDELIGRRWTEFSHPDEMPLGEAVQARVAGGHDSYEDERRYLRPDGTVVWASTHVT